MLRMLRSRYISDYVYGQEWLPQVLHEIVHQMKRVGDDILKDHHRTSFMCAKAEQLTDASLGSNLGGPLSEEPPENQLADFSFAL